MAKHIETGKQGENLALKYLLNQGYALLESNYRYRKGEIDLIVQLNNEVIFVEVKTRTSSNFGFPREAVNIKKQKLLLDTANQFAETLDDDFEMRFDVIEIILSSSLNINHIKEAFHPFDF